MLLLSAYLTAPQAPLRLGSWDRVQVDHSYAALGAFSEESFVLKEAATPHPHPACSPTSSHKCLQPESSALAC